MNATHYKVLVDSKSCHGGSMTWSLPDGDTPGNWHRVDGRVIVCQSGLHLTCDYTKWLKVGCEIYEAEGRGDSDSEGGKTAFREARLIRRIDTPDWWRETERRIDELKSIPWLKPDGKPDPEWRLFTGGNWAAARAAAWDAARAAAWDAALDAAADAARDAAWDAARVSARAAALDAALDAARDAARAAAWDAALDAAADAARDAAADAAWDAAWDAARVSAWDAARDAAADAAWDAARDAALWAGMAVLPDGAIDAKHVEHAKERMDVWRKGYALLCDLNGVLYVYAKREM